MFTDNQKLWIAAEVKKQTELFLEHLRLDHTSSMITAATRLEAVMQAVTKVSTGQAELRRLVLPAEGPPHLSDFEAEAANSRGEPK